jgi:hypothetical protein
MRVDRRAALPSDARPAPPGSSRAVEREARLGLPRELSTRVVLRHELHIAGLVTAISRLVLDCADPTVPGGRWPQTGRAPPRTPACTRPSWCRLGNRVGSARFRGPGPVVVEDDSLNPTAARLDPGAVGLEEPIQLGVVRRLGASPSPRGTAGVLAFRQRSFASGSLFGGW